MCITCIYWRKIMYKILEPVWNAWFIMQIKMTACKYLQRRCGYELKLNRAMKTKMSILFGYCPTWWLNTCIITVFIRDLYSFYILFIILYYYVKRKSLVYSLYEMTVFFECTTLNCSEITFIMNTFNTVINDHIHITHV